MREKEERGTRDDRPPLNRWRARTKDEKILGYRLISIDIKKKVAGYRLEDRGLREE